MRYMRSVDKYLDLGDKQIKYGYNAHNEIIVMDPLTDF